MPQIVIHTHYHKHSDRPEYNRVHAVPEGQDPALFALLHELLDEFGLELASEELDPGQVALVLQHAREHLGSDTALILNEVEGESDSFVLRCDSVAPEEGTTSLSVWPEGNLPEVVHIGVAPYQPNPIMRAQLEGLTREALIAELLVLYAEHGYLPHQRSN